LNKHFFAFSNRSFLKTQFSNGSFFAIWFKIALFLYKIAISNAHLKDEGHEKLKNSYKNTSSRFPIMVPFPIFKENLIKKHQKLTHNSYPKFTHFGWVAL
jgi:hypothetical protein